MPVKVYTTVEGLELRIGNHGLATNTRPAVVPDEVASELEAEVNATGRKDIRIEREKARTPSRARRQTPATEPVKE